MKLNKLAEGNFSTPTAGETGELVGLKASTSTCSKIAVVVAADGTSAVTCKVKGSAKVNGEFISWVRSSDKNAKAAVAGVSSAIEESTGAWECVTTIPETLAPKNCLNETTKTTEIAKLVIGTQLTAAKAKTA